MALPLFLEVDPQDETLVKKTYPKASVMPHALSGDALVEACKGKEIVSCFIYSQFTADVLKKLPDLKLLCTRSVGFNHIDVAQAQKQGITVCNVPDYGSHVIAEHVFALVLTAMRHITEGDRQVQEGKFDYHGLRGMALLGKTIGIIGTGKIGHAVARIAHGFGMKILAVDVCRDTTLTGTYHVEYTDLPTLLQSSDIISLHVPVLQDTQHMIDAKALAAMKDGVILVNTARGELIDSMALLDALKKSKVAKALLDVLEHEKDFQWNKALIQHPNVIVTPHIAFYADDSMHRMYSDVFDSIKEWQAGRTPRHTVKASSIICDLPGVKR